MPNLRSGATRSCGCLRKELQLLSVTKHGHTSSSKKSRTYGSWAAMISRCYDKNHEAYKHYGARGITVCDEWLGAGSELESGFVNFLNDMGERLICWLAVRSGR